MKSEANKQHRLKGIPATPSTGKKPAPPRVSIHRRTEVNQGLPSSAAHVGGELIEIATTHWVRGDWQSLMQMEPASLPHHPERMKLALFLAAAQLQTGHLSAAEELIDLARQSGAGKQQIARILVSGAYNSLARASALAGGADKGLGDFERSLALGLSGSASRELADARSQNQLADLGLMPDIPGRLQTILAHAALTGDLTKDANPDHSQKESIDSDALGFYQNLANPKAGGAAPPFLLIDSKSLPRSGLHYLKNTLSKILGDHFSFCEWYQEIGCCKKHPCALRGYANYACKTGSFRLRLIKSHDFGHADPAFPTSSILRRLVLVRDPLFTLTSWFELDEIAKCGPLLLEMGIDIRKVWLLHEKEILQSAYEILERNFDPPSPDVFKAWLLDKTRFMTAFINDWVTPYIGKSDPHMQIVNYDDIDRYVLELITPFREYLSPGSLRALDEFSQQNRNGFVKREDPFSLKVRPVETYIRDKAELFHEAARQINARDGSFWHGDHAKNTRAPSGGPDAQSTAIS